MKLAGAVNFLRQVTKAFEPKPGEVNAAGVEMTGFEHVEMMLNVEDRLRAGFSEREIEEVRRQENQLRATSASKTAVSS